ncbi:MAG: prepilin peptidase [Hyphomicrobiales bacterium]|nr:prepilin peptidase [Hyphomicrobiales bacterium]
MIATIALLLFPWAMAYAAASDLFTMTISNRVSLLLVAGFIVLAVATGMDIRTLGLHVAAGAVVFSLSFFAFAMRWIGGGDAKLAAATALWFGWSGVFEYLLGASILGGLLTLGILALRSENAGFWLPASSLQAGWIARLRRKNGGVPYGIALAATGLIMYPDSIWMKAALESLV